MGPYNGTLPYKYSAEFSNVRVNIHIPTIEIRESSDPLCILYVTIKGFNNRKLLWQPEKARGRFIPGRYPLDRGAPTDAGGPSLPLVS